MEHLGDELLGQIFLFVHRDDQRKLFQVSRQWHRVMDEQVGIDACVGRGIHSSRHLVFDSIRTLSKFGVRSCRIDTFINNSPTHPKLKRPNLLKFLKIRGFLSSAAFESIISGVTNLHTIQIDHSAIHHLEFSDIAFNLPCQSLEVIGSRTEFRWNADSVGLASAATNAVYLFRNVFPGLKRVWINLNFIHQIQGILTNALLTLLTNHSASLTCVHIEFTETYNSDTQVNVPQLIPMEIVRKEYPNLRELHLLIPEFDVQRMEPWTGWLEQLRNLESCEITRSFPEAAFNSLVTQCEARLQSISLNWDLDWKNLDLIPFEVNCSVLQNCVNLTSLKMAGKKLYRSVPDSIPSGLLNIEALPKSLISIEITDIDLPSMSCKFLCLGFPALERLTLTEICGPGHVGRGVLLPVIREIFLRKQLKQFRVEMGHGNEEDAQEEVIKHAFRRLHRSCYATGFLNKNGKYTVRKNNLD